MHMYIRIDCCTCIQWIRVYIWFHTIVSIVANAFNAYVYTYWLHTFVSFVLQMHPMHMCICMVAHVRINCFPYASNVYVYTFDCTGSYQLLQMHPMNMCIHMIAHIHINCFANASNTYVYLYDCTCLDWLLHTHHPMHKCIHMIAHVRIDCFAYTSNAYVYTYMIAHVRIYCYLFTSFSTVEKWRESKCFDVFAIGVQVVWMIFFCFLDHFVPTNFCQIVYQTV